jgi:HPt (histidine-containing phosphotransfer) domain-containing protein
MEPVFFRTPGRSTSVDPTDGEPLLDRGVLLAGCGGKDDGLRALCEDFDTFAPDRIAELNDALRDRDAQRTREVAHRLCGLLSAFSSVAGRLASKLEDHAATGELDDAVALAGPLASMTHEIGRQIRGLSVEDLKPGHD